MRATISDEKQSETDVAAALMVMLETALGSPSVSPTRSTIQTSTYESTAIHAIDTRNGTQ